MLLKQKMDKENVVHNNILKFVCICMELEKNIQSEVAQTQKDKHDMYSLISGS